MKLETEQTHTALPVLFAYMVCTSTEGFLAANERSVGLLPRKTLLGCHDMGWCGMIFLGLVDVELQPFTQEVTVSEGVENYIVGAMAWW